MNQLSTCGDIFQVTPPQRQLFQLNRAGDVFCLSVAVDGPLDPDRLQQALVDLADGREILRTRYSRLPGQKTPVQQVMHEGIGSTEMVNLGSVEETDPAKIADAFTAQLPAFDLAEGPLLRVAVAAPSEGPTLLLMVFPAIVAGADGAAALLEALVSAYAQVGKTVEEEEIVQYGAFAEWQLDLLEDEETADEARAYWDRQLRVSPLIPKHHTAATVVEQGTYAMGTRLSQRVFDYCDEVECTPSAFWLSCWQIWLRSRHGAGPFRLAARVSRREGEGLESVLGPLFKDVPLAVNPTTEQSFSQLSEQTGDQLNGADDYAEFFEPTTNVNGDAEPPAALLWSYESALVPITGAGLNWNPLTLKRPSSPYRLESAMSHGKEGFSLFVQSKGGLRVASHATGLAAVAEAVLSEPERAINQLDLLTRDEKEFLQTFNQTEREPGGNPFLHRRFEVAAARHPSRVAVGDGRKNYTYAELNQRANRVADRMIQAGVVADNLVALEGHGHPDFVVGLLAILKAGGAYVPLDPDLPVARLEKMHDNLGRPPVLYLRRPLPGIEPDSQWDLDALAADSALDDANPSPQLEPCNLAYALFTSGSTGEPKAVLLEHAQLANYLDGVIAALDLQENASYGMISSPAADLGNTMLFPSLALGGNLRIFDYQVRIDPEALSELLEREPLDYLKIVPSHLTALLESESSTLLPRRSLILGGEAATSGLLAAIARLTPDCTVYNHYGPTETCVGVLVHKMGRAAAGVAAVGERGLPLGRPLANTRIYLRDAKGEEVPPGVTGEICIAGASLARGYLGRPDLSSERFGVDPTGARFYRTGDLAFFHEGDLYFVGRLDHQVKIRGFRVELGEIETVLRRVSAASEAAVMVDSEAPETGLIGYLAGLPENLDESRLRADLERELPAHMIPTRFMCLDRLPLNANGKLDRKALPKPQDQGDKREYAAPTNERERHLCGIWQRALGLEKVGVTDNFFHLGGDSVIAIKIMAHAKKAGILLTPKLIFDFPTVSTCLAQVPSVTERQEIRELGPGPYPLTPVQRNFFRTKPANAHHWNMSLLLSLRQTMDVETLALACRALCEAHPALRLRFPASGGQILGPAEFPVEQRLLPQTEPDEALEEAVKEVQTSLDLENGPLIRGVLFKNPASGACKLLLVTHHLIIDGVSWRILLEDLLDYYTQLTAGTAADQLDTGQSTTPFPLWAEQLQDSAQAEFWSQEARFWTEMEPSSPLAPDFPDGSDACSYESQTAVTFEESLTEAFLTVPAKAFNASPQEVLLAALVTAASSQFGLENVGVLLENHGRRPIAEDLDISRTVGWFTCHYPLTMPAANNDPGSFLLEVKERMRRVPNQGVPFGMVREMQTSPLAEKLAGMERQPFKLNYLGQLDRDFFNPEWFAPEQLPAESQRDPAYRPPCPIRILAAVQDGKLHVNFAYSTEQFRTDTLDRFSRRFQAALQRIIDYCSANPGGAWSPSDFPLARLSSADFEKLTAQAGESLGLEPGPARLKEAVEGIYPLSPIQEGFLFHGLYNPENDLYFRQISWVFEGDLQIPAFIEAWRELINHHQISRCGVYWRDLEHPVQVAVRTASLEFEVEDWRDKPSGAEDWQAKCRAERERGFNLGKPPLMRLVLLRLSHQTYRLIWSYHHLIMDGWSKYRLLEQVFARYFARVSNPAVLPALPANPPFSRYLTWLSRRDEEEARVFWQDYLKNCPEPTMIRAWEPAAAAAKPDFRTPTHLLGEQTTTQLRAWAARRNLTLNNVSQVVWGLLLAHYSNREDVIFGTVVSGRSPEISEVEAIMGPFINSQPVRLRLQREKKIEDLLREHQEARLGAARFEDTRLVDLRGWTGLPKDRPIYHTSVIFYNYPVKPSIRDLKHNLRFRDVTFIEEDNYPLSLAVSVADGLQFTLKYDRNQVPESVATSMSAALAAAIPKLIESEELACGDLFDLFKQNDNRALQDAKQKMKHRRGRGITRRR